MNLICNKASYDLSCKNILHYSFFILTSSLQAKRSDYTYDQVGNRLTYDSKYGKITYEYDDNSNRLTRVNFNRENDDLSYILINYDANGNTIQRDYFRNKNEIFEQELYEYNYDNMMEHYVRHKPVMKNNRFEMEVESELNMKYDVNGMRVIKECYPNTSDSTIYIYEGSKVVLEMTYEQIPKNKLLFTYAGEKKVSRTSFKEDGTIDIDSRKYFHQNFLGSIAMITDKDGNIEEHNKYEPFGDVIWSKSYIDTGNNYKFTGKERDKESHLDYFNARYLDTKLGRFMKADIVTGDIQNPQTLNRWIYCVNNPMKYVDLDGFSLISIEENFNIRIKIGNYLETSTKAYSEITCSSFSGMGAGIVDTFKYWDQTAYEIWEETKSSTLNLHATIAYAPFYTKESQKTWENWTDTVMNIRKNSYDFKHGNLNVDAYEFGYKVGKELMKTEIKLAPLALLEGYVNYKIGNSSLMKGRTTDWKKLKVSRVKESKHVLFQLEDIAIESEVKRNVLGLHKPDKVKGLHLVGRTMEGEEITYFDIFKKK